LKCFNYFIDRSFTNWRYQGSRMLVFRRLCVLGRPPGLCRPGVSSAALCRIRAQSDASDGAPRKIPEVKRITRGAWKAGCDCFCQCFLAPVVSLE
jgi:hypothetical protein